MSYDIVVFDPSVAPRDRQAFSQWFAKQTDWIDDHDYNNPDNTIASLRHWYDQMRVEYPAMNGPDQTNDDNMIDRAGDYNFAPAMIYTTFPWSLAEEIYAKARELAVASDVGFYDVSDDNGAGEIYFPGDQLRPPSQGTWRSVAADFRSGDVSKYIPDDFPSEEAPKRRWFDIFRRDK
jgi:hypothetical protein